MKDSIEMMIDEALNTEVRVDGVEVKVGDWVGFKADIEQSGEIIKIRGRDLILSSGDEPFHGDYIGGTYEYTVRASDAWLE